MTELIECKNKIHIMDKTVSISDDDNLLVPMIYKVFKQPKLCIDTDGNSCIYNVCVQTDNRVPHTYYNSSGLTYTKGYKQGEMYCYDWVR